MPHGSCYIEYKFGLEFRHECLKTFLKEFYASQDIDFEDCNKILEPKGSHQMILKTQIRNFSEKRDCVMNFIYTNYEDLTIEESKLDDLEKISVDISAVYKL